MSTTETKLSKEILRSHENGAEILTFDQEMAAVIGATAIERQWMAEAGAVPFHSDGEIIAASNEGELRRIRSGAGYRAIDKLLYWNTKRSSSEHEWHYSPPYLQQEAADVLEYIGSTWAQQLRWEHTLSASSMVRNIGYQTIISKRGKLAISPDIGLSTHVFGYAFDIDACGLNVVGKDGEIIKANPRMNPGYEDVIEIGHMALRDILGDLKDKVQINWVDEFPGTPNNCFHVAVKPSVVN